MTRHTRRKHQKSYFEQTMDIVKAILLVVIAVAVVVFVIFFIKDSMSSGSEKEMKASIFSTLFQKKDEKETETSAEVIVETEPDTEEFTLKDGLTKDKDGNLVYVKDGALLVDTFLSEDGELYYFDEIGFACTDEMAYNGFLLSFTDEGTLTDITVDPYYQGSGRDYEEEYPGLVKDNQLMAFLKEENTFGRFTQIAYKKTVDTMSHVLGGNANPQYTTPGTMQLSDGYIYWLPYVKNPDETEALISGRLYRMKPDEEKREVGPEGVTGYLVVPETGEIWYAADGRIERFRDAEFSVDNTPIRFTEDMDYVTALEDGKLWLRTAAGYPVTMQSDGFHVLGFTYKLSSRGEILGVSAQDSVKTGGFRYSVKTDEAFGLTRCVLTRTDEEDLTEIISAEFAGTCENIYYNASDGCLYIEYRYADGGKHILRATKEGDVDLLLGGNPSAGSQKIIGFADDKVYVKEDDTVEALDTDDRTAFAKAVTPVSEEEPTESAETGPASSAEITGPASVHIEVTVPPEFTVGPQGPQGPGAITAEPGSNAPGAAPQDQIGVGPNG